MANSIQYKMYSTYNSRELLKCTVKFTRNKIYIYIYLYKPKLTNTYNYYIIIYKKSLRIEGEVN